LQIITVYAQSVSQIHGHNGLDQRCADPEIFESTSVRRFWPRIRCQSASATKKKYWIRISPRPQWI